MYIGSLSPVSNRAGMTFIREVVDDDTDEPIDLSDCAILFEVRDGCSPALSASIGSGVTVLDTGVFQVEFTAAQMKTLCPKSYEVGCIITRSGEEPQQFIIGTLPVLDGVVSR